MGLEIENGVLRRCTGTDEEVRVPDGVRVVFDNAFSENRHLRRVVLPASLREVGSWAFNRCQRLESVALPEGLARIGRSAFRSCIALRDIRLPVALTSLGGKAFEFCKSISRADIPTGIRAIDDKTFSNCSGLRALTIPDGVERIGGWAFEGCASLREVAVPDSVRSIGEGAFLDCASLEHAAIGVGVRELGADAFSGTPWLEDTDEDFFAVNGILLRYTGGARWVAVPDTVTVLCAGVFECVPGMEGVVLPDSVRSVGEDAFENCPDLRRVELSCGITSLGGGAFELCRSLQTVTVRGLLAGVDTNAPEWDAHRRVYGDVFEALSVALPPACGVSFPTVFAADETGVHASFGAYCAAWRKADDTPGRVRMALSRLLSPLAPEPGEMDAYRAFLSGQLEQAMRLFIQAGDLPAVRALGELSLIPEDAVAALTQMATEAGDAEIAAWLLRYKRERFGFHAPTFEL